MTSPAISPLRWQPGEVIGTSSWLTLDQRRITAFGELTNDVEPLHTDPDWCRAHSPVGRTMSYGFLTLSLLTSFLHEVTGNELAGSTEKTSYPLNYGFDRIRFVAPVPVNSRLRAQFTFLDRRAREDGELMKFGVVVELDGSDRPALTAEWWSLWIQGVTPTAPPAAPTAA